MAPADQSSSDDAPKRLMRLSLNRRAVVKGAAWSVPIIAVSVAAPAHAASAASCPPAMAVASGQVFTLPSNLSAGNLVTFTIVGGGGGSAWTFNGGDQTQPLDLVSGGDGAKVAATFSFAVLQNMLGGNFSLVFTAGEGGQGGTSDETAIGTHGSGGTGYNPGNGPAKGGDAFTNTRFVGGGGGGAAALQGGGGGNVSANTLMVAAGGGGAGSSVFGGGTHIILTSEPTGSSAIASSVTGVSAGADGGTGAGTGIFGDFVTAPGGSGATTSGPGAGGTVTCLDANFYAVNATAGGAADNGSGGNGGGAPQQGNNNPGNGSGGGAGGGYYGGGGGGWASGPTNSSTFTAGGGGAGASFVSPLAAGANIQPSGNGATTGTGAWDANGGLWVGAAGGTTTTMIVTFDCTTV